MIVKLPISQNSHSLIDCFDLRRLDDPCILTVVYIKRLVDAHNPLNIHGHHSMFQASSGSKNRGLVEVVE